MAMTFRELVQRMVDDQPFRAWIFREPDAALESVGVTPTPELVQAIRDLDQKGIDRVLQAMEGGTRTFLIT